MLDLGLAERLKGAATRTMARMLDLHLEPQTPMAFPTLPSSRDLSAEVGFSGRIEGSIVVRLGIDTARRVASLLTRRELDTEADQICDAVGELTAMVASQVWADEQGDLVVHAPLISIGEIDSDPSLDDRRYVSIPFVSHVGSIQIDLRIGAVEAEPCGPAMVGAAEGLE